MARFVTLHNRLHKNIKVNLEQVEAQGARERMVPVVMSEFLKLVVQYPIVFTKLSETGQFVCVALLGFEHNENLFWENDRWQGIYTPLNIVRQPFFIGRENDQTLICIDAESECLSSDKGELIFDERGEETDFLRNIKTRLAELVSGEVATREFVQALLNLDLLLPMSFDITFVNQQEQRVQGLYTIDEEKLEALTSEKLLSLHQKNYLKPIYILIASLGHLYSLVQKKNERIANN